MNLKIGDRVEIVGRDHPWRGEHGTITQAPTPTRFLGTGDWKPYVEVEIDNPAGHVCGAKVDDVQQIVDFARTRGRLRSQAKDEECMDKHKATVIVQNVNAVPTPDGVLVEFEYAVEVPGVGGEWGAAQRLVEWPIPEDRVPSEEVEFARQALRDGLRNYLAGKQEAPVDVTGLAGWSDPKGAECSSPTFGEG